MARLILVRHGETEWNRLLRYQGQSDIELNRTGLEQAAKVRDRLAGEMIDSIYCSDLKRAVKTAEIIAEKHPSVKKINQSPLLREMDFGDFEGLNFNQMRESFPHIVDERQAWRNRGASVSAPNGESIAQLGERVSRFAQQLPDHDSNETTLLVAHGGSLQVLMCQLLGVSLDHWWQVRLSSTAVSMLETYEQGVALTLLNDVCHLE